MERASTSDGPTLALGHSAKIFQPEQWEAEMVDKSTEFFGAKGESAEEFKAVFANGRGRDLMVYAKKSGVQRVIDKGTRVIKTK